MNIKSYVNVTHLFKWGIFFLMVYLMLSLDEIEYLYAFTDVSGSTLDLLVFSYFIAMLGLYFFVEYLMKKSQQVHARELAYDTFSEEPIQNPLLFIGSFVIWGILFFIYTYSEIGLTQWLELGVTGNEQNLIEIAEASITETWFLFSTIIKAPVLEELLFRRLLFYFFFTENKLSHHIAAVLLSGITFGLLHETSISIDLLLYILPGILLALSYRVTKDFRIPVLIHVMNNFISSL